MNEEQKKIGKKFTSLLLTWNGKKNNRQMPWKGEKDPYKIWLSEVILQQTRVEQGLKYYQNFIKNFPDVHSLANASDQKVFKQWEGLGYYSRCKNLLQTARYISKDLKGIFPKDYGSILSLKGVGSYTAAAIASFAYNLPHAVLDGNVFRVISRIMDIEIPVDTANGKKVFNETAQQILPKGRAGEYNQAIMDFGAVICKPVPLCNECFFNKYCSAYLQGKQLLLPIKEKKLQIKERWFNYVIIKYESRLVIRERVEKDIWQHLYEFPLLETQGPASLSEISGWLTKQFGIKKTDYALMLNKNLPAQKLTHQKINFRFVVFNLNKNIRLPADYVYVSQRVLKKYAFPKTLAAFIADELVPKHMGAGRKFDYLKLT